MDKQNLANLRNYMGKLPAGPVSDVRALERVLALAWDEIDGTNAHATEAYKLIGRMERTVWEPPTLRFTLARHLETVRRSIYETLHHWAVDLGQAKAHVEIGQRRRVERPAPSLNCESLAEEIRDLIVAGCDDPRLKWTADRAEVRVLIAAVIPETKKQTTEGRRKRFREAFALTMAATTWKPHGPAKSLAFRFDAGKPQG